MSEVSDRYQRLTEEFIAAVNAVPADRWSSPSPCEGWTALDVVDHTANVQGMFLGFVGREAPAIPPVDLVVHRWDLTRATGGDETIDPADAERVIAGAAAFGPALRSPGVCGPEVEVGAVADVTTRMLALVGRRA